MKAIKKYLVEPEMLDALCGDYSTKANRLLVMVTNELISYRNQLFDGASIPGTNKIPNIDDREDIKELDDLIDSVKEYLREHS